MNRSTFIAAGIAALVLPFAAVAQTDWPQKPVTMVVPYPPGGVNDAVARVFADKLGAELGKPVLIDPKGSDYSRYSGATVITPNRAELQQVVGAWSSEEDLRAKSRALLDKLGLRPMER